MRQGADLRQHAAVVLAIAFVSSSAAEARADVAPDPDSIDAHCTLEEQCPSGTFCPYSNHPDTPTEETQRNEACVAAARSKGLAERCTDGGGTVGQSLYCPTHETGSWSPGCSRCAFTAPERARLLPLAIAAAIAAAAARRRRR